MSALAVRPATIGDAEPMARVMASVAEEGFLATEPPVDVEARARQFDGAIEGDSADALWVVDERGTVVGHIGVHERLPGVFSVGMAIMPQARGRGGGRALLEAAVVHARACGAHKVDLEVWTDNGRAIALYAGAGFEVEGVRRRHYRRGDGRLRSSVIMGRLLIDDAR